MCVCVLVSVLPYGACLTEMPAVLSSVTFTGIITHLHTYTIKHKTVNTHREKTEKPYALAFKSALTFKI